ncbi:putative mevalonate kinase [Paratrimastix pyriformis]|uniref:Mevalonate kinase n=1 Tax=Paratrimastix pyriformis TaxID=342808 RepID=A0ABQ8UZZ9_9EUKA|nr:putative mevalonate kinase [Paratrimastix pyriformis]
MAGLRPTCCSAPGKAILFGEHAVVYGYRCLVGAIDLRTTVTVRECQEHSVTLVAEGLHMSATWDLSCIEDALRQPAFSELLIDPPSAVHPPLVDALRCLAQKANCKAEPSAMSTGSSALVAFLFLFLGIFRDHPQPVVVVVSTRLPIGSGLGSSGSFAVALAAALLTSAQRHAKIPLSECPRCSGLHAAEFCADQLALINQWAYQSERLVHTNPSGVDNTCSTYGGVFVFCKTPQPGQPSCSPLQGASASTGFELCIVDTCVPRETKRMVEQVAASRAAQPGVVNPILASIDTITTMAARLIESQSEARDTLLGSLVELNHLQLSALGLSIDRIEEARAVLKTQGIPAKITGAGGGGCLLGVPALHHEQSKVLEALLNQTHRGDSADPHFRVFFATCGCPGVTQHPLQF